MNHPIYPLLSLIEDMQKSNMTIAEIGVYDGITSELYLPTIKKNNGYSYLVDWFMGQEESEPGGLHGWQPEKAEYNYNILKDKVGFLGYTDIVKILNGKSVEMARFIPDDSLDICFIDADHRRSGVIMDILAYLPKVKNGGILCGHDAEHPELIGSFSEEEKELQWFPEKACHPGVLSAIDEIFIQKGHKISFIEDSGPFNIPIWVYSKT